MKKKYKLLSAAALFTAFFASGNLQAQCPITATANLHGWGCSYGDQIDTYVLDGIAASNAGCSSTAYTHYLSPVWSLTIGNTYTWSATTGNGNYDQGFAIWI